ncbi:MAG: hypothetical protein LBJ12_09555 [Oscillospiraceae bacterium]|jgi:hypothetical protein|nr:hypothetical protein [Oscillospiraceae bacterium]
MVVVIIDQQARRDISSGLFLCGGFRSGSSLGVLCSGFGAVFGGWLISGGKRRLYLGQACKQLRFFGLEGCADGCDVRFYFESDAVRKLFALQRRLGHVVDIQLEYILPLCAQKVKPLRIKKKIGEKLPKQLSPY